MTSLAGLGSLVTSIFGAGNSQSGNTASKSTTGTKQINENKQTTYNKNLTDSKSATTANTGTTGTAATATQNATKTVGTADAGALATAKGLSAIASGNATNPKAVNDLVNSVLNQASVAFGSTAEQGNAAGVYNSSTESNLKGYAEGQATADATSAALTYQTQQQQLAETANQSVLSATEGTTASGATTANTTNASNTGTTSNTSGQTDTADTNKTAGETADYGAASTNATGTSAANGDSGGIFSGLSLICGEMKRTGKMDNKLWWITTQVFMIHTSTYGKKAYWSWATPFVEYMKKKPESKIVNLVCWLTKERANYVAWQWQGEHGEKYSYRWTGKLSYWIIWMISLISSIPLVLPGHVWDKITAKKWKEFDDFDRSIP